MKACLIGKTLKHSFSKEIHQMLGREYDLVELQESELSTFVKEQRYACYNVTIPYKEAVMPLLDEIDPTAAEVGAVNTVVAIDGKKTGYNTDIYGIQRTFNSKGISVKGKNVVVLGSGGTSKTACAFLRMEGAKKITVISRSGVWNYENYRLLTDTEILINATPVGMFPNVQSAPVDLSAFPALQFVFDVIYNPLKTELLLQAEKLGIAHENGLPMLVYQAIRAEEIWQGSPFSGEVYKQTLSILSRQKNNVVLVGMPSSGKTSIGRLLAKRLGKTFVDFDEEIERQEGMSVPEIFKVKGEEYFRQKEREVTQKFSLQNDLVIATGGGAVVSEENRTALKRNGVVFWILRNLDQLSVQNRPVSKREGVAALFEKRKAAYKDACHYTVENHTSFNDVVEEIVRIYEKNSSH